MPTYTQLCSNRGVPDMDVFSHLQFEADTGRIFNGPKDIPTPLLTKECIRDWLGAPLNPTPIISHPWRDYDDDAPFTTAH